jgi:hypothetical protein
MKHKVLLAVLAMTAGQLVAADSGPKDDLVAAAKKLTQEGYTWKQSLEGNFNLTIEGKAAKDGTIQFTANFNDNIVQAVLKGEKGAVKLPDDEWKSLDEISSPSPDQRGPGRFAGRMLKNYKCPGAQLAHLIGKTQDITKDGDIYTAELTEAGAKSQLLMGGRRGGTPPEVSGAKGSIRISMKDGAITKYELRLQGSVRTPNGDDRDLGRTVTTVIRDVGATTLDIPDDARKKMS